MTDSLGQYEELVRGMRLGIREFGVEVRRTGITVRIAIGEYLRDDDTLATLLFYNVIGLKFEQAPEGFPLGLQIVADNSGWENVAYKITDPEYGIASFWSADFQMEKAEQQPG